MKKLIFATALIALAVGGFGLWHLYRLWRPSQPKVELRAMMRDEDAPRAIMPSVGLQVNEGQSAEVPAGTPLWFTVGVNNAAASNELSAAEDMATRLAHLSPTAPNRARLQADFDLRSRPATITLGSAAHPWTEAVHLLLRDAQGGERPVTFPIPPLGRSAPVVNLDAFTSVQASFGTPAATAPPGTYSVMACLGETGSWHGRACSEAVQLTVRERTERLDPDQQSIVDRREGRFALVAGDAAGLEQAGRKLITAAAGDVEGHMYMGEARYLQSRWADALAEFTTARSGFRRSRSGAGEPPRFLDVRISQILNRLEARR